MSTRDLLYALRSRSKKIIRDLDDFAGTIATCSFDGGWTVVTETITLVNTLLPTETKYKHTIKAVNRAWLAFADQSDAAAHQVYGTVILALEQCTWTDPLQAQRAYQLLYAFHANHLHFPASSPRLSGALRLHAPRILGLIETIAPYSTHRLFTTPVAPEAGVGGDAIGMLLDVFFYHAVGGRDDDLRAEAAACLPQLVRADPGVGNHLTLSLVKHHPERAHIVAQLIDIYLCAGVDENAGSMFADIMLALLDNSGRSFIYDDLDKIAAQLAPCAQRWTAGQRDTFARYAFFYRLQSDDDRRLLLAKSQKTRRLASMIVDSGQAGMYIDKLRTLYASTASTGTTQPAPARPVAGAPQFKDLNLKLLVIDELMYVQQKLLPRFDVHEFVRQYTAREIMIEREGYAVIPEVLAYFEQLAIPSCLLAQVDVLTFDGSDEVYRHIFPYWDGESDTFDVRAIDDIGLLPNLKRLSSMPTRFVERYAAALRARSIDVD